MEFFKGRTVKVGQEVDVYRNLHHGGYSIRCSRSKMVLARCDSVRITDCEFRVSEPGRQKVLEFKRKSVHAYIKGIYVAADEALEDHSDMTRVIYYNPYETDLFKDITTNEPIKKMDEVFCYGKVVYAREKEINSKENEQLSLL
ncbi:hypothetical protein [Alkalihalobacillus sp. BA299]|uniref:hypothetical protein n=1 Tax=Alkalihalobacillus sp. BA299 TaxID=2815938 RepID=UPI001AD97FE1|nr:hypothetical protein [Alkalihalobacillus sp. BA299]